MAGGPIEGGIYAHISSRGNIGDEVRGSPMLTFWDSGFVSFFSSRQASPELTFLLWGGGSDFSLWSGSNVAIPRVIGIFCVWCF